MSDQTPKKPLPPIPPQHEPSEDSPPSGNPHGTEAPIPPLEENPSLAVLFEKLLKSPLSLIEHLGDDEKKQGAINLKLGLIAAVSLLIFGLTIGSFAMHEQLWAAPAKILCGTIISAIICFPSLYIFTSLTGTDARLRAIFSGFIATLALLGVLLLGFAPVLWVFSQSTDSLGFMGFLIVVVWLIAVFFGIGFLRKLIRQSGTNKLGPLNVWAGIFLLVTLQMSTTLRPILGRSDHLLTNEKKFFLQHWGSSANDELYTEYEEAEESNEWSRGSRAREQSITEPTPSRDR